MTILKKHRAYALPMATAITVMLAAAASLNAAGALKVSPEPSLAEGFAALEKGDFDKAWSEFMDALTADQGNIEARIQLGLLAFKRGLNSAAVEHLSKAIQAQAGGQASRLLCGIAEYRLGLLEDAMRHLKAADEISPSAPARLYMALVLDRTGKASESERMLIKAVQIDPSLKSLAAYADAIRMLRGDRGKEAQDRLAKLAVETPSSPVSAAASETLQQIKPPRSEQRLNMSISVEEVFDSNVILQSSNSDLPLPSGVSDEKDFRSQIRGHISGKPVSMNGGTLSLDYRLYEGFNHRLHMYDFHQHTAGIAGEYKRDRYQAVLPYSFSYSFVSLDYSAYSWAHTVSPKFMAWETPKASFRFNYEGRYENFFEKDPKPWWNRTGWNHRGEIMEFWRPVPAFMLGGGYAYQFNDPKGPAWRYQGHHLLLELNAVGSTWFKFDLTFSYVFRDFDSPLSDPDSAMSDLKDGLKPRKDNEFNLSAQMTFIVFRDILELGFGYTGQFNRSNASRGIFDWNRSLLGLSFRAVY